MNSAPQQTNGLRDRNLKRFHIALGAILEQNFIQVTD